MWLDSIVVLWINRFKTLRCSFVEVVVSHFGKPQDYFTQDLLTPLHSVVVLALQKDEEGKKVLVCDCFLRILGPSGE